jgi:carbon monoxide dehydrogenase subunit G
MSAAMSAVAKDARAFTSAPMRNRIRLTLDAPLSQVWALVGDLSRLPEYSGGLDRVEVTMDYSRGRPTGYACHFKPQQEGEAGLVTRERIRWYDPARGWASAGAEPVDAFGIRDSLHQVTVEPSGRGTLLIWAAHYDAEDGEALAAYRASLDEALGDIAERLIARFGGRLLSRAMDTSSA